MTRFVMAVCAVALGLWGLTVTGSAATAQVAALPDCQHAEGDGEGNKHIKQGETMCWTPKMLGADTRWTYYVYGRACNGAFDDTSHCYAQGRTYFTFR